MVTNFWDPTSNQEEEAEEVFLIFLSHVARLKDRVQKLKEGLEFYGVVAFVAHSDIHPGTGWQDEILAALSDMDAFVPVLTEGFRESDWTDQEVGFAIARGVPIIPLRIDMDPYGFMGSYQGLPSDWEDAPKKIIEALLGDPLLVDSYISAVASCSDFYTANQLSDVLPSIEELSSEQASRLVNAFNTNVQLNRSYGFNGAWPAKHGMGLAAHLSVVFGKDFGTTTQLGRYRIYPPWPLNVGLPFSNR